LLHLPLSAAARARDDLGSRRAAVPTARIARGNQVHTELMVNAMGGFDKRDAGLDQVIITALRHGPSARTEDVGSKQTAEQIAERAEAGEVRCESLVVQPLATVPVIDRTSFGVAQHLVRFGDLLESILRPRVLVDVGMVFASKSAKSLLDLRFVGSPGDAQDVVVVAGRSCHNDRE
jgi:hypothetical protein